MVLAVIVIVAAVIVVAVPIVVDAVHDDHPRLLDPYPRMKRADAPERNGRPPPVARMARNVVTGDLMRMRRMAMFRAEVSMPSGGRRIDMMSRSGMFHHVWFGCRSPAVGSPRLLGRAYRVSVAAVWSPRLYRASVTALRSTRLLGCSSRMSVAAVVPALRRSECGCAECRAGKPDESEFQEVVVHSAPSLSVCDLTGSSSRPYIKQGDRITRF